MGRSAVIQDDKAGLEDGGVKAALKAIEGIFIKILIRPSAVGAGVLAALLAQDKDKRLFPSLLRLQCLWDCFFCAERLDRWDAFYMGRLEPRMIGAATSLANLDTNIRNLQERAHVWDTFQLHVAAWNDQIKSLHSKVEFRKKGFKNHLGKFFFMSRLIPLYFTHKSNTVAFR